MPSVLTIFLTLLYSTRLLSSSKIALMPILYDISYINPILSQPMSVSVRLSKYGFPNQGWHTDAVRSDFALIFTIGRVGLMARFIRTFALVHASSSACFLRSFHPKYWWSPRLKTITQRDNEEEEPLPVSQRQLTSSSKHEGSSRRIIE